MAKKVVVLGFGNPFASDDGVGPEVLKELRKLELPRNVEILEVDALGTDLPSILEGAQKVLVVDALKVGATKGSLLRLRLDECGAPSSPRMPLSAHGLSPIDLLLLCRAVMGKRFPRDVIILGVEVEDLRGFKVGLSEGVRKAIPGLAKMVLDELRGSEAKP